MPLEVLQGIAGIGLGFLVSLIYVHHAWYNRDEASSDIRKNVKIKAMLALLGQNGIMMGAGFYFTDAKTFFHYSAASAMIVTPLILVLSIAIGFIYGYSVETFSRSKFSTGIRCGSIALFQGWRALEREVKEQEISIQAESKLALSRLAIDAEQVVLRSRTVPKTLSEFRTCFQSLVGFTLYSFFQHSDNQHPDYCGYYFKYCPNDGRFYFIAGKSGNEKYACEQGTVLGKSSYAYRALKRGDVEVFDRDNDEEQQDPDPPLRKKLKRFITVPVPPGEHIDASEKKGVLCIDSAVDGWQFRDPYHRNILRLIAFHLSKIDENIIGEDVEWKN